MNRRSFFAFLPALPFIAVASAAKAAPVHLHTSRVDPTKQVAALKAAIEAGFMTAGEAISAYGKPLSLIYGTPRLPVTLVDYVSWEMPPSVGAEAYAGAYEAERAKGGGYNAREISNG